MYYIYDIDNGNKQALSTTLKKKEFPKSLNVHHFQQPQDVAQVLVWCWPFVAEGEPAFNEHFVGVLCLLENTETSNVLLLI